MGRVGQVHGATGQGEVPDRDDRHDRGRGAVAGAQPLDPVVVLEGQKVLGRDAKAGRHLDVPGGIAFGEHPDLGKVVVGGGLSQHVHRYHIVQAARPGQSAS